MTLLVTVFAAVASTVVWYVKPDNNMKVGILCFMYWGASLMWLVDSIAGYIHEGTAVFTPDPQDMLNDLFLGLCAIALGLVIWIVIVLVTDPRGNIRKMLKK